MSDPIAAGHRRSGDASVTATVSDIRSGLVSATVSDTRPDITTDTRPALRPVTVSGHPPDTPGAAVLDEVAGFIGRYVSFPTPHALTAVTLWAAHTHATGCFYVTPRLVLDSAEPGSGKTRVLELLALLCHQPEMIISVSTAALFRMISEQPITILFDEVDAIFNPKNGGNNEDLRALLNSGYKRGATIPRCVGDARSMAVQRFTVFSPVALAGLAGNMPATILTRAVTIHMRRRAPGEHVEPFEEQYAEAEAAPIRQRLAGWIAAVAPGLAASRPVMPGRVVDRPAEVWRALLAVADAAGAQWPDRSRDACRYFVLDTVPVATQGIRLLADLKALYADRDRLSTVEILAALTGNEEQPWADLGGKPLDARRLARELGRYDVTPTTFTEALSGKSVKGYTVYPTPGNANVGLGDAWQRYLPTAAGPTGNFGNFGNPAGQGGYRDKRPSVTSVTRDGVVTDPAVTHQDSVTALTRQLTEVTEVTAPDGPPGPEPEASPAAARDASPGTVEPAGRHDGSTRRGSTSDGSGGAVVERDASRQAVPDTYDGRTVIAA